MDDHLIIPLPEAYEGFPESDNLYFIRGDRFVKIGRSHSASFRLKSLQSGCPFPIRITAEIVGMGWQEAVWHKAFRAHRSWNEWFVFHPQIQEALAAVADGEEWIATTMPPEDYDGRGYVGDIVDIWRDRIADFEEVVIERAYAKQKRLSSTPSRGAAA